MKPVPVILATLAIAAMSFAQQDKGQQDKSKTPAATQAAAPAQAQPAGKHPPQLKTDAEAADYKTATAPTDAAGLEKAADDFSAKYPDSEVRVLLYKGGMRSYQSANNLEKMADLGRKVLAIDADDPEALVDVAQVLAERTRDTDLDRDQKLDEGLKYARKAIDTVDTDLSVPAGTPQDRIDAYKGLLRSSAYSIIGTIFFTKSDFANAETNLQKSIDAFPSQPDSVTVLRLAIARDKQTKYTEALVAAEKAVSLTQEGTNVGTLARRERDRLKQLTNGDVATPKK